MFDNVSDFKIIPMGFDFLCIIPKANAEITIPALRAGMVISPRIVG